MHIMTEDEILREKMIEREEFYADMRWLIERTDAAEKRASTAENRADAAENRADAAENRANMAESELAEYKAKFGEL